MYINSINVAREVSISTLEKVKNTTVRWLLPPEIGVPNFEMRYFEIKKGGHSPKERHSWEHEAFVVKGKGAVVGEDGETEVKTGDAIYVAPNELHQFKASEEDLGFICVIPKGAEDKILNQFKPKDLA